APAARAEDVPASPPSLSPRRRALAPAAEAALPAQLAVPAAPSVPAAVLAPVSVQSVPAIGLASQAPGDLKVNTGAVHRRHQQSLLRLMVSGLNLPGEATILVRVSGGVSRPAPLSVRLGPGGEHEFDPLPFIPRIAGSLPVQLALVVETVEGQPVGRWTANL